MMLFSRIDGETSTLLDGSDLKHTIAASLFAKVPPSVLGRLPGANPAFLFYHLVSDDEIAHVRHLSPYKNTRRFREDLDHLLKEYHPLSLADVLAHFRRGTPFPARSFLLSFDDGFREMHDIVAPILLGKGVPAVFFLCSDLIDNGTLCFLHKASLLADRAQQQDAMAAIRLIGQRVGRAWKDPGEFASYLLSIPYGDREALDRFAPLLNMDFDAYLRERTPYLSSGQVRGLIRDGFAVGAHSIDHPLYSDLDLEEQLRQTIESVRRIRQRFQLTYGAFAFPYNDHRVSGEFFRRLRASGDVDVSFGTSGLVADDAPCHLQRLSLEKPPMPAVKVIALECARKLYRMARGGDRVIRS